MLLISTFCAIVCDVCFPGVSFTLGCSYTVVIDSGINKVIFFILAILSQRYNSIDSGGVIIRAAFCTLAPVGDRETPPVAQGVA